MRNEAKETNELNENETNKTNEIKDCKDVDDANKKDEINVNVEDEIKTENVKSCEASFDFFACFFRTCQCSLLLLSK